MSGKKINRPNRPIDFEQPHMSGFPEKEDRQVCGKNKRLSRRFLPSIKFTATSGFSIKRRSAVIGGLRFEEDKQATWLPINLTAWAGSPITGGSVMSADKSDYLGSGPFDSWRSGAFSLMGGPSMCGALEETTNTTNRLIGPLIFVSVTGGNSHFGGATVGGCIIKKTNNQATGLPINHTTNAGRSLIQRGRPVFLLHFHKEPHDAM